LDSGDLGYLVDDELYLTGRVKDLIIRAGQNLHPSELEEAIGELEDVRKGCVAVFPASDHATGTERLVVLAETRAGDEAHSGIRRRVIETALDLVGTPPDEVVLAPPGTVPKTSSGKIRRATARERYERGQLTPTSYPPWRQLLRLTVTSLVPRARLAVRAAAVRLHGSVAWGLLALVAVVVWPLVAVLPGLERRWRVVCGAGHALLRLTGTPLTVEGRDRLPAEPPYVVAANHTSNLDALVLALVLPPPVVFAAVGELATNPLARVFLRRLEVYLVERGDRRRGREDAAALTDHARAGRVVAFFPEGRRSRSPGLERFHLGAFTVAADAGVPVVPLALRGTRTILPVGRRLARRGRIEVTVCEPVTTDTPGWAGAVELHHATRAAILRHCGEPDLG
jgi:1-acyl-sn-glycerol-3-phosphate acyltransferase